MKISPLGLTLIKSYEGLGPEWYKSKRVVAYLDQVGVPTIGWGHTGPDVTRADVGKKELTLAQAEELLAKDVERFEGYVNQLVKVKINQYEFDALVSFCYNVGPDIDADTIPEGLGDSTLLRKLNAGDKLGAAKEFVQWINAGGKPSRGLLRRRLAEALLFTK